MFTTISNAFKIASNLANIKTVITTVYTAIVKITNVINFVYSQIDGTELGKLVEKYLPVISSILTKIKDLIEKYGQIIGIDTSSIVISQSADHDKALADSLKDLENLLK